MENPELQKETGEEDLEEINLPEKERRELRKKEFFKACKEGDIKTINHRINDKYLDILALENNWPALHWAVICNHPEVVKIVYKKQKILEDKLLEEEKAKKESEESNKLKKLEQFDEFFKKPLNATDNGKYTPLHWSAYKGLDVISSILLRLGCDPLQVDSYGNNALHQACASNLLHTFKLFMGLGINLQLKNSRSHMPIDLTTNKEIQDLIRNILKQNKCQLCGEEFNFYNQRFLCSIHDDIICKKCCTQEDYYETEDSPEKEIRDCRCLKCHNEIVKAEQDLNDAIKSNNLERLDEQIKVSFNYKICLRLRKFALQNLDRLKRERQITVTLDNLKEVEVYKTIKKSVDTVKKMVEDADNNKVSLDVVIIERAFLECNRLEAERDLRCILENLNEKLTSKENLDNLSQKVENAEKCKVADKYVDEGKILVDKMTKNLAANALLAMMEEYPIREYPEVEVVDPKNKKKKAPEPKKKKKKKEPPFIIPEWATLLTDLQAKVAEMKGYVSKYAELGLSDEWNQKSKEQLARFAKEIPFRKEQEEELKRLEEEKAAKKKKKK